MSRKTIGVLLLLSFWGISQAAAQAPLNSANADVSFDVGPSPTNGYSGTMGLGGNADQGSPDHTTTVLLRPKPPYDFIGEPNAPMFFSGTVPVNPAPTEVARNHGWTIKNVVADTEVILSGKIGTGGPGTNPAPEFDVNTAVVDLQFGGASESQEVPGPNGGAMELTSMGVCTLHTRNLPSGSSVEVSVLEGSVTIGKLQGSSFGTDLSMSETEGSFYINPPSTSSESLFSVIEAKYTGLDGGVARDVIVVAFLGVGVGVDKFTIQITAWIPFDHLDDPLVALNDLTFKGDGNGKFKKGRTSYRMRQTATVVPLRIEDTSRTRNGLVSKGNYMGKTVLYQKSTSLAGVPPKLTAAAKADVVKKAPMMMDFSTASMKDMKVTSIRSRAGWGGEIRTTFKASGTNPLHKTLGVIKSPAIDWNVTVKMEEVQADQYKYTVSGSHDGFPAYDIYIDNRLVYSYDPRTTGEGPGSLFPGKGNYTIDPTKVKGTFP